MRLAATEQPAAFAEEGFRASPMKVYPDAHMTKGDASVEIETAQVEDLETLQRRVSDLARKADAATQTYDRTAWIRYAAIFVPIPFVVLIFRLHMQAWHYYVAGALFLAVAVVLYAMDLAAVAKRDKAIQAVRRAQEACEVARMSQRDADERSRHEPPRFRVLAG